MYINFWYPICTSEELDEGKPVRAETLGVRLVAFRDSNGSAHVLSDTCVHRGGSLGEGKVVGDHVQHKGDLGAKQLYRAGGKPLSATNAPRVHFGHDRRLERPADRVRELQLP